MIRRFTLFGQTKEEFPLRIHIIRTDSTFSMFLAIQTPQEELAFTDQGQINDNPYWWQGIIRESIKSFRLKYFAKLQISDQEFYKIVNEFVEYDMKQFTKSLFASENWETIGWFDNVTVNSLN